METQTPDVERRLRRIERTIPYPFVAVEKQGVTVDDSDNPAPLYPLVGGGRTSKVNDKEQQEWP